MKRISRYLCAIFFFVFAGACRETPANGVDSQGRRKSASVGQDVFSKGSFGYDLQFVSRKRQVVILKDKAGQSQVMLCPELQGRVLTSTASGLAGRSFGYLNYARIGSDSVTAHIQSYGGEDRFWIGPQGGQFSIFFKKGDPFDLDHWQTPLPLDRESFKLEQHNDTMAIFSKTMQLQNFSGTKFDISVKRRVRILDRNQASRDLHIDLSGLDYVGFESQNLLSNTGDQAWHKTKGLLSVWILGMFPGDQRATVILPCRTKREKASSVTEYFTSIVGRLPDSRLRKTGKTVYYKGDGNFCSKIGLGQDEALPVFGFYNASTRVLTILQYTLQKKQKDYVNSDFSFQKYPYKGDVVNSYNDGSLDHKPLMPSFCELESSSPALELRPGESVSHIHRTFHLSGKRSRLNETSKGLLGVSLDEIEKELK